jgi:DNA-binding IscR family transcriptional regulator
MPRGVYTNRKRKHRQSHYDCVKAVALACFLGCAADPPKQHSIQEISKLTGISWDTSRRCLDLLVSLCYVREVEGKNGRAEYVLIPNPNAHRVEDKLVSITEKLVRIKEKQEAKNGA